MNCKIVPNSDKEFLKEMIEAIKANDGYCPCSLEKTPETKCMCRDFIEKYKNGYIGECNCGTYQIVKQ
jgi:hypothetical protein